MTAPLPRILCVDDEPYVLEGLKLHLRKQFDVVTAVGGAAGIEALRTQGPFAIIISDMRMPLIDGVAVLAKARHLSPMTTRILLTGQADTGSAIAVINEAQIFKFLTKPIHPPTLMQSLEAALREHQLHLAEREVLAQTLRRVTSALAETLALVDPIAFSRAATIRRHVTYLVQVAGAADSWAAEVAATFALVGRSTLPESTKARLYAGDLLTEADLAAARRIPGTLDSLLADIPRLELVRLALAKRELLLDVPNGPGNGVPIADVPPEARVLRIVLDYDELVARGLTPLVALNRMQERYGWYDPALLRPFEAFILEEDSGATETTIRVDALRAGMLLGDDLRAEDGTLLAARGYEITDRFLERIAHPGRRPSPASTIRVWLRCPAAPA